MGKYLCRWTLRGFPVEQYIGDIEVYADDELAACRLARRIIWAGVFSERPMDFIKVWIVALVWDASQPDKTAP
jgi:hypothetical protein